MFDIFKDEKMKQDFLKSLYDNTLHFKRQRAYIIGYFDDIHIRGPDLFAIIVIKGKLTFMFKTINLYPIGYYLYIKVN